MHAFAEPSGYRRSHEDTKEEPLEYGGTSSPRGHERTLVTPIGTVSSGSNPAPDKIRYDSGSQLVHSGGFELQPDQTSALGEVARQRTPAPFTLERPAIGWPSDRAGCR